MRIRFIWTHWTDLSSIMTFEPSMGSHVHGGYPFWYVVRFTRWFYFIKKPVILKCKFLHLMLNMEDYSIRSIVYCVIFFIQRCRIRYYLGSSRFDRVGKSAKKGNQLLRKLKIRFLTWSLSIAWGQLRKIK